VFSDASGVFRGDAVKLAGVDVGRVDSAHIENGKAVVLFNVNKDVKLTRDSVVSIRWRNVLGQRFLYVYPGTGGGPPLTDGDRIPLAQTETAGDIGAFLNHLGPILRAINPDEANAFLDAVNTALVGNEADIRGLVTDGATLAGQLSQLDDQIKSLISSSDIILSTYASQDRAIGSIVDNLDLVSARLNQMTDDINSLLVNFSDVQQQLDRLLADNRSNIDASLRSLQTVAKVLQNNRSELATTLCTLPIGLANYFQTTSWGEWFNVRITQVILRDSNGGTIFQASELPQQQSPDYAGAITGCENQRTTVGLGKGSGSGKAASTPPKASAAAGGSSGSDQSSTAGGFESIGGLVTFVTGVGRG
ncbi:MAG TPA: MCE family protein, partial [Actinomycetota bacterium]